MTEKIYQPGECYENPLLIKKLLNTPLIYSPDREIVYGEVHRYTYRDLYQRIGKLANGLTKIGIDQGDTVAVFDYDSHRYLECFFAIPMMGAVLQTVNWRLSSDQLIYTINHAEAKIIVINSDFLHVLEPIRDSLETVEDIILINETSGQPVTKLKIDTEYEELLQSVDSSYRFPDLNENTRATTFYTTGTTGDPKGVYYSHRQLVLHTLSVAIGNGCYKSDIYLRSDGVYMPLTPMFHVHAWGFPYVATMIGAKQVYPGKYEPEKLLRLIRTEKVTFSHCVPTILQMILNCPDIHDTDLSNWSVIIGGARLPKGQAKAAKEFGIKVVAGYGMSETCPVMTNATPLEYMREWDEDRLLDIIIKTGKPVPLAEIEVVDPNGNILPHDGLSTGEVVMRAPWLTEGYFKEPEKTKDLWRNGWLHSGDVGYIDEYGYLQITDRIKDVIKTGGEWVSSLDLENLLSQHEAVLESAAIGVPDEKWGERPLMIITLKPGFNGKTTPDELKQFMLEFAADGKIPKYGVPDKYVFMDELPRTSVGKIDKKVLRATYCRME